MIKKYNKKGIGLIEVIAALGLSVVVLTSLVSLSVFTVRSSLQSKLMLEGSKIANREMELIRAFRDGSDYWYSDVEPTAFLNSILSCTGVGNNTCYMDYNTLTVVQGAKGYIGTGAKQLIRYFYATDIDGNPLVTSDTVVRISVVVSWNVGSITKYARLYTDLTNWENK